MKPMKYIITKLILIIMLVILMGSTVLAESGPLNLKINIEHVYEDGTTVVQFLSEEKVVPFSEILSARGDGNSRYKSIEIGEHGGNAALILTFDEDGMKIKSNSFGAEITDDSIVIAGSNIELNVIYDYTNESGEEESEEVSEYQDIERSREDFFKSLESFLSGFVRALANGLNYLVQMALTSMGGSSDGGVDIDAIIFNNYPDTNASFFTNSIVGGPESRLVELFREAVNKWYNVFNAIAVMGYMVILLYLAVKILLRVGGSSQSKYKESLMYWVVGLLILIYFPNAIKFAIDLNNSLVEQIEESKSSVLGIGDTSDSINMIDFRLPVAADPDDYKIISWQMDQNPYSGSSSYMSDMATRAHENERLVDAVVYLIMVWQFIMIVIMYYKRIFSITFLICIFPFVALSYAFDKVGDGKAQAFDTWTKEIMTNIFVQSIHALVYVFVVGAVYEGGSYSGDWLLMIIGISFLFQGEQILKKIIGLEAETVKSLSQTAVKTLATVKAARVVTSNIADNVIGSKSHLGRTIKYYREWQTESKTVKNMDFFTYTSDQIKINAQTRSSSFVQLAEKNPELAEAIQVYNGDKKSDSATMAKAFDTIMKYKNSTDPDVQGLMQFLNLSDEQLNALADVQQIAVDTLIDGDRSTPEKYSKLKEKIDHDLDIHLEAIVPGDKPRRNFLKRAIYYRLRDSEQEEGKHKVRSTDVEEVKQEFQRAKKRKKNFWGIDMEAVRERNRFNNEIRAQNRLNRFASQTQSSILSTHYRAVDGIYSNNQKMMARHLAILKDYSRSNSKNSKEPPKYTAKQVWQAASYVAKHENDSRENKNAVKTTFDMKGEEIKAIVAEEICREYTPTNGDPKNFRDVLSQTENAKDFDMPDLLTELQRQLTKDEVNSIWKEVKEYIQADDEKAGVRLCYDETLDEVSVKDILRKERLTTEDDEKYDEAYISYIVEERKQQNREEINIVENFAREQLDDLPEETTITYNGLSKAEHEEYSKQLRSKFMEELTRTGATTTGVVLGASIGTGLAIGLGDSDSIAGEALAGMSAGALAGDFVAEEVIGREELKKKVKIMNPYTGEPEYVELQEKGALGKPFALDAIKHNEVLRMDDLRLMGFQYDIRRQFLATKQKREQTASMERKKNLFNDALENKNSKKS